MLCFFRQCFFAPLKSPDAWLCVCVCVPRNVRFRSRESRGKCSSKSRARVLFCSRKFYEMTANRKSLWNKVGREVSGFSLTLSIILLPLLIISFPSAWKFSLDGVAPLKIEIYDPLHPALLFYVWFWLDMTLLPRDSLNFENTTLLCASFLSFETSTISRGSPGEYWVLFEFGGFEGPRASIIDELIVTESHMAYVHMYSCFACACYILDV